jgi:hypothetical protein
MARIKTVQYEIDGQVVPVNFNCSSEGKFSTNLSSVMMDKLGIDRKRLEGQTLQEIEKVINDAFIAYKNAKTSYRLLIKIDFGVSGSFTHKLNGEIHEKLGGYDNPLIINNHFTDCDSLIGLDYDIIIEENRDGRLTYFQAVKKDDYPGNLYEWNVVVGDYFTGSKEHFRGSKSKLIEYDEQIIKNLDDIIKSFQKASTFLVDILTDDNVGNILSGNNLKALMS